MLARTARVPAMRGALPDDAGDVVATFGGPLAARPDDVFADPFVDGDGGQGPRLRLLLLRDAAPTLDRPDGSWLETSRTADAVRVTAEEAGVRVTEVGRPRSPAGAVGRPRRADRLRRGVPGTGQRCRPGDLPHVADLRDRTR